MDLTWVLAILILCGCVGAQRRCPMPKAILPCRCLVRAEEYQIWCTHSDLPSVLDGLRAAAKFIQEPIDELILENNYLPALPGRTFYPLKILRLMLRHNGLERVSNDWLGGLETTLMELFIVEPKLRSIPEDSLLQLIALQAITIQTNLMKRLPLFSGLPKLRYLQIESTSLLELSPRNFKDNPSLEKLHIGHCPRLNRLEAHVFRDLPSLGLLNISHCGITWMHHRAITRLPVLRELVLVGNRIPDAGMVGRASRELPQLEILRLDYNYIDRLEEAAFVDLPALRTLHLPNNRITELNHGAFHRVPRLRKLNLNGNFLRRVHPESFLQESGSGLEELWLVRNEISHVADLRAIFDALPRLVFLDMSYNQLEAIPYGSLRGHPTLEYFNLDHNRIHLIDREAFVAMPALRELRLKNNSLSNTLQPPLWNLPELKGLDLSENFFRRLEPNFLQELPSLRKLDLSKNQLTFIDPAAFSLTPSLENINLSFNALATLHPATFRHLLGLYELDVSNNMLIEFVPGLPRGIEYLHVRNNDIVALPLVPTPDLDLPALRMLDLTANKIELLPKEGFSTLPQLRRLYLRNNLLKKIDDATFKGLTRLETLDLTQNRIIHLGSNAFNQQSELRDISLGYNNLENLPLECFQNSLHLKKLNLTRNMLSEIVPGTLDKNKDLQMIDISHNRLLRLSSTFMDLKNLRILDATHNRLNTVDPEILGSLPSLRALRLSNNLIKELKENGFNKLQHLASLDLEENELEVVEPNAMKTLPALKKIKLSRNKIKEIPNMVFVNLPSLQTVELQENRIRSIAPNAFIGVPHLLMLNLSYNQISSFEEAGLRSVKSLELLDISHNDIRSLVSPSLEKLEWLVELRIDSNKICGVHGSPFNNMPRLRVLSMRDNKMMSFPERAVERIRNNIALLDIEGNPLACSCNMLWLQVWLHETASMGPTCADGYLLRELELLRDCPEEERNVEVVAPGCEAELLSAPGIYGTSQVFSQWMNLKSLNGSEDRNSVAPSPEESEYFYDEYVDYPYNETNGKLTEISTEQVAITTLSPHFASDNISTNKNNQPVKNIPKEVNNSPSSSGFTFFGVPLPNIRNLISNAINSKRDPKNSAAPMRMDDRIAIVNKPTVPSSITRMYNAPPNVPKFETGGFVPILPGTGGFKPIPNPSLHQAAHKSINQNSANEKKIEKDTSTLESQRVPVTTTNKPKEQVTTEVAMKTVLDSTSLPSPSTTISALTTVPYFYQKVDKMNVKATSTEPMRPSLPTTTENIQYVEDKGTKLSKNETSDEVTTTKLEILENISTTEYVLETTTLPTTETTTMKQETTTMKHETTTIIIEAPKNQTTLLQPLKQVTSNISKLNYNQPVIPQTAFLIPKAPQSPKKMATITKVHLPNVPSASSPFKAEYDALPPLAHNRETEILPTLQTETTKDKDLENSDLSWYFATYNTSSSKGFSKAHSILYIREMNIVCILVTYLVF